MQELSIFKIFSFTLNFKRPPNQLPGFCATQGLKKVAFKCIICLLRLPRGDLVWPEWKHLKLIKPLCIVQVHFKSQTFYKLIHVVCEFVMILGLKWSTALLSRHSSYFLPLSSQFSLSSGFVYDVPVEKKRVWTWREKRLSCHPVLV